VVGQVGSGYSSGAYRWWASNATASATYSNAELTAGYSPWQVTGMPDSPGGDNGTAWAPPAEDGGAEWLEVYYLRALVPTELNIYENCGPGFVREVEAQNEQTAEWLTIWQGHDPTTEAPGVFSVPLGGNSFPAHIFRIHVDTAVPGWNEIDAVEVVGNPPG